jgi:phosphoribosylformylglycinamidine synthase PurS subunit
VSEPSTTLRYAVNVRPKPGILDPQGRAVEGSLAHLAIAGVSDVRVGRRVELTVSAATAADCRAIVDRLATELLSNPLIESFDVEEVEGASSIASDGGQRREPAAAR